MLSHLINLLIFVYRDAVQTSSEFGNRKCYQLPPPSRMLGKRAILRDYHEGSDIILVKPMLAYLDMIREASDSVSTMY